MGLFGLPNLPDPLNVHKDKSKGGMGLPDPLNLFENMPAELTPAAAPNAPPPSLITPTPIATDSDKKQAQRRMQATSLSRKGRASTILSDDTLGSA